MAAATCPLCASAVPDSVVKGPPTTVFTCPVCSEVLTWSRGRAISSKAAVSKAKALHGDLLKGVDEVLNKPAPALPPAPVELAPRPPPAAPAAPTKLTGPRPAAQPRTFTVPAPPTRLPGTPMVQTPIAIAPEPLGIPAPPKPGPARPGWVAQHAAPLPVARASLALGDEPLPIPTAEVELISEPLTSGPGVRPTTLPVPAPAIASVAVPPPARPAMETRGATAVAPAPAPIPPPPAPSNVLAPATPAISPAIVPPATPAPAPAAPAPQPDVLAPATPAASVAAVASPAPTTSVIPSTPRPATSGRSKVPLAPVALLVMALLGGAGWALFGRHSVGHTEPVEAKREAPPSPSQPAPPAEPAPAPAPVAAPAKAAPAAPPREAPAEEPKAAPAGTTRLGGTKVVLEYDRPGGVTPAPTATAADNSAEIQKAREVYQQGNARLFNGDAKGAREAYLEALKVYPGYVAGYRGLGFAYEQEGDARNALTAFKLYVKTVPTARDVPLIKKRIEKLQRGP